MLKRMGTKLVIINLTIAMVFSNAVEAWALRPPSAVESSKKKRGDAANRGADRGFMTRAQHQVMREFLERVDARNEKNARHDLEDEFGVRGEIRIQAVPGMYKETGFRGHYAIRDGYIYIDEDTLEGENGKEYLHHEIDELMEMKIQARLRNWSLDELVQWLEEGDVFIVARFLTIRHNKAHPLPTRGIAEIITDLSDRVYAVIILRGFLEYVREDYVAFNVSEDLTSWKEFLIGHRPGPRSGFSSDDVDILFGNQGLLSEVANLYTTLYKQKFGVAPHFKGLYGTREEVGKIIEYLDNEFSIVQSGFRPVRGAAAVPPITGGSGVPQILVLSNNVSLLEGAQTGAYPFEAAFQDGARGFILNHSERRGRLENKMENMLRATRDLIRSRGASNEAVKNNWVKTLKTENLPDKEIEAIYSVFFDYFWTRIRMLDEQDNVEVQDIVNSLARRLVNKIINAQLKKDIAYSDKYPIFQTVLCVGETEAQYNAKRTQEILNEDLNQILEGITQEDAQKIGLRIAYEPRWAIGTGLIPPLEEIQATHRFIKETLAKVIGQELEVDYGGSLSEKNKEILALADVDGGLIGTAAKTPEAIEPVIDEAIVQSEKKGRIMNIGMNWKAEHASTGLSPLDAFVELFRTKDLSRVQIAIGTPTVKLVRDRMTELEKEINAQRKKDIPRTRVAINGFGRIGKLVLKAFLENPDNRFEIVAINDLDAIENLAHLFRHDSTFGEFKGDVGVEGDNLIIDDQRIKVLNEKDPAKLPWKDLGIEIVIEASGRFTKREGASKHLEAGAKKVVITAPGEDEDLTVVLGVNEDRYNPQKHQVISNASCTTNCLAPVVKVLKETFGIKSGSMLTVHAATNDQNVLDTVHSDQRRARATLGNIIPTSTGAAKAIGKVIPELQGRLDGLAMRVPTSDVSAVYLDVLLERDTTKEEVNAALKKAAEEGPLSKYLGYTEESLVSSDFLRSSKSGTVDASLTKVINKRIASVVIWYDNEWGYSNRTVQLVNYMLSRAEEQRQEKEGEGKGTETVAVDRLTKLQSDMIAKHIAKALNINTQEALAFVKAETDIYVTNGGGTFLDFIDSLRSSLDFESKEIKGRALIVGPDFFRRGGLTHGLRAVALLSKAVKLAVYGENAQRLKILMGNENIVSASTLDTALKELENKYGISPKDTVLLHSPQETLDEGALKAMNARQIVAPEGIPATLALSKALKELLGEVVAPAFEELLKDMAEAGVIEQKSLNENRQALLAMLEEGQTFAFSEDLKTTEEVAKDAEVVRAKETIKDFMNKHI